MTPSAVLLLPGWQNSGELHWQSLWEGLYRYVRVQQHDWMRPLRGDWLVQLEEAVLACEEPVVLVAHSLGCIQVAAWAAHTRNAKRVKGALLVAPGDVEREDLRTQLPGWSPIERQPLPFRSMLVASHDDPYCSFARAQAMARDWGAELTDLGHAGHINADSGLGEWPQGQALLRHLQQLN